MITRSVTQFMGFILVLVAFIGWSWLVLEGPLALLFPVNDTSDWSEQGWLHGPYFFGQIQLLVNQLIILSEIGAVAIIGCCLFWLAYQALHSCGSLPISSLNQQLRK